MEWFITVAARSIVCVRLYWMRRRSSSSSIVFCIILNCVPLSKRFPIGLCSRACTHTSAGACTNNIYVLYYYVICIRVLYYYMYNILLCLCKYLYLYIYNIYIYRYTCIHRDSLVLPERMHPLNTVVYKYIHCTANTELSLLVRYVHIIIYYIRWVGGGVRGHLHVVCLCHPRK